MDDKNDVTDLKISRSVDSPLVSVITVVRNGEASIEQAILSVLNQSYRRIEYIIVDGESYDSTVSIIKKYENSIAYWTSEKDAGIYDAMNKGIRLCTGDIIGILNADDMYTPYAVEAAVARLQECHSVDIVHGDLALFNDGSVKMVRKPSARIRLNKYSFSGSPFNHPTVFVRRSLYSRIGTFDSSLRIAADRIWLLRSFLAGAKYAYIPKIMTFMRMGGLSDACSSRMEAYLYFFKRRIFPRPYTLLLLATFFLRCLVRRAIFRGDFPSFYRLAAGNAVRKNTFAQELLDSLLTVDSSESNALSTNRYV